MKITDTLITKIYLTEANLIVHTIDGGPMKEAAIFSNRPYQSNNLRLMHLIRNERSAMMLI